LVLAAEATRERLSSWLRSGPERRPLTSTRLLGSGHASAATARDRLGSAYESAGISGDAIVVFSGALAEREHDQGPKHVMTRTVRQKLGPPRGAEPRGSEA
jgi:hypothetical protein